MGSEHLNPAQFGFHEDDPETWEQALAHYEEGGTPGRIRLDAELHTGQGQMFPDAVEYYADKPGRASATSRDVGPVEIYEHDGKTWVGEGHHRIAAARSRGQRSMRVKRYGKTRDHKEEGS